MDNDSATRHGGLSDSAVTSLSTHHVRSCREQEFEAWLRGIAAEAATFHGHQGLTVLRPADHRHPEYVVVLRFATYEDLRRWETSTQRAEWLRRSEPLRLQPPTFRRQSGLETWFTLPGHAVVVPPPNYKMAAIVLTALYPILIAVLPLLDLIASSIGEPFLAAPVTVGPEFAVGTLVATLIVVPLMTWIAMPLLTMLAGRWLYPRS